MLLCTRENYGLGPIIRINRSSTRPPAPTTSMYQRLGKSSSSNIWGTIIIAILVISSPIFIYQTQKFSKGGYNPGMTGYGVARPNWGIAGLGHIAHDFCVVLTMTGANISAVAAGSLPDTLIRARSFADEFDILTGYGSYAELASDPAIDIVYIAATTQLHYNITMLMLNAGKNVLVEKPTSMSASETKEMFALAQEKVSFIPYHSYAI